MPWLHVVLMLSGGAAVAITREYTRKGNKGAEKQTDTGRKNRRKGHGAVAKSDEPTARASVARLSWPSCSSCLSFCAAYLCDTDTIVTGDRDCRHYTRTLSLLPLLSASLSPSP